MAHNLIVGMTESGKTTLAKILCANFKRHGLKTAVLDPMWDEWETDYQTNNPGDFLKHVKENRELMLFVDEGATSIGRYNTEMEWLATTSRHFGHSCFFISQRGVQMSVTLRSQCKRVFMFASGERDANILAEEWNEPILRDVGKFEPGQFFIVSRFEPIRCGRVDFDKRTVYYESVQGSDNQERVTNAKDSAPNDDDDDANSLDPNGLRTDGVDG